VLSLLTVLENGAAIETANIGREGAFGLFAAMYSRVSFNRCIVQLEGHTVRCPIQLLQYEFRHSEHVRDLFVSYSETLLSQVQQTVACNAMHSTEERMCRWLLMMHDRAEGEALPYTHEFLSHILGANRKSVTLAAQSMQTAGLIRRCVVARRHGRCRWSRPPRRERSRRIGTPGELFCSGST
jgi:CRP-like cAMP-binding protein